MKKTVTQAIGWAALGLAIVLLLSQLAIAQAPSSPPFYLGGIQVNEPDVDRWVEGLQQADMNTVEVTIYAHQGDWDSDNLWFDPRNGGVVQEIRTAKAQGLHVVLILRVALDHAFERNDFLWHGLIMPHTDAQLQEWFERYTRFVLMWAAIAQDEGVDVLGIGSEMNTLTSTRPVTTLPDTAHYYLDTEKQEDILQTLTAYDEQSAESDGIALWSPGGQSFDTLNEFLTRRLAAWQQWARQTTDPEAPDAIAHINQRRQVLEQHWRTLIRQVRQQYGGQLTYAANFDQYQDVTFWDDLDFIGINAYFSLRSELTAMEPSIDPAAAPLLPELPSMLEAGWREVLSTVEAVRQQQGVTDKPILFTELGYTFRSNSTVAPWAYEDVTLIDFGDAPQLLLADDQTINYQERALAIQALHRVVTTDYPSLLGGILYWKLSTLPEHIAIEPFVLILNTTPVDPMQAALAQFIE